jgi:mono/diheme cytochrome c family protein
MDASPSRPPSFGANPTMLARAPQKALCCVLVWAWCAISPGGPALSPLSADEPVKVEKGKVEAGSVGTVEFARDVLPILRERCVRCHGPVKQESRVRLDTLSTDLTNDRAAAEHWHEVRNVLNSGEMPPEDEPQLSVEQRATLLGWVNNAISESVEAGRDTDGRVVLRRLNRVEYANTMFDLLGLEMDYARDLPPDPPSADGFLNNGQSLRMSAIQLEYYLDTARRALDRVIVSGPAPKVHEYEFPASNVNGWLGEVERSNHLGRRQEFLGTMVNEYPEEGEFQIYVRATAQLKPNVGFPLLELSVGYRPDTQILFREVDTVELTSEEEQEFEFRGRIENHPLPVRGQGKYPGLVVRIRNAYDDGTALPKRPKEKANYPDEPNLPTLDIKLVKFRGPFYEQWPPASHRRILADSDLRYSNDSAYVAEVLEQFLRRAYRRPVEPVEVQNMVNFYSTIRPEFPTFEEAIRETLAFSLIRPDFLYLMEPAGETKRAIGDWELASRLSYFLWSTMPDERLFELAKAGTLHDEDVLANEVERMLVDSKASRFAEQFTEQWLHLDVVDRVAVSRDFHPNFDNRLKGDIRRESHKYFAELVEHDLSALNLLKSEFTMLNGPLARHYGVDEIYGRRFRRVELAADKHRGGLLGQASILLSNSTGSDSHAVRRAVWIRDRLLNDPPAPPPPDVPSLDEAAPEFLKLSIREQLEVHRGTAACASCHRGIDPWGIALENFDAVGLWREEIQRKDGGNMTKVPVNATDTLPNGRQLNGFDDLRTYLADEKKDEFARSLVSRLLTYGLGRRLELSDETAVDDITSSFVADGYRLRGLVKRIVLSDPFQTK